ncbi:MAG TPA: iron-containing redox enzyme family protein [Allosphingosinicella sp.]|nr:iron-containing redox enzyme family protein [Allosphingosinicella sp.]
MPDFGDAVELLDAAPGPGELYRAILLAETHPHYLHSAYRFAVAQLEAAPLPEALLSPAGDSHDLPEWILRLEAWARTDLDAARYPALRTAEDRRLLLVHFAPTAFVDGCWLERATGLATAERTVGLLCQEQFRLRASGEASRALFGTPARALVRDALGRDVEAWHEVFTRDCEIAPRAFEYALAGLCLGQFPASFLPEIAGFELWQACVGSCPPLVRPADGSAAVTGRLVRQSRDIVGEAAATRPVDQAMQRVLRGFITAHQAYRSWRDAFEVLRARSGPEDRMLALIEAKARFATGYHGRVEIGGTSLDSYFERGLEGWRDLLSALAASDFVCPARPEWSRLLTSATRIRGRMFGVFTADEITTIENWIRATADGRSAEPSAAAPLPLAGTYTPPQHPQSFEQAAAARFGDSDLAELSYYFLNADLHPLARAHARKVATAYARLFARLGTMAAPDCPVYSFDALDDLVEGFRLRQLATARADHAPPAGPQALVRAFRANYPLMCTDGSWLQGSAQAARMHQEFNLLMFDIYREENGGGDPAHNHNRIARRLLSSMGANHPPTSERAFYDSAEADATFFGLCGNLALALNPLTFMPEILGLNLAIETSGVGWQFPRGAADLRAAGFDGLLLDLHESIDNFASGHSMASRRSIASYLDHTSEPDPDSVQRLWTRIWNGCHGMRTLLDRPGDHDVQATIKAMGAAPAFPLTCVASRPAA